MAPVTRPLPVVTLADLCGNCTELLVLAPHPDDETLACGGLMQAALAARLAVRVIVVSDGEACFGALPPADRAALAARRRAESVAAAKALGLPPAALTFWGRGDGALSGEVTTLAGRIAQAWSAGACLIAPWPGDGHPDHAALGRATMLSFKQRVAPVSAARAADFAQERLPASAAQALFYPLWSRRPGAREYAALMAEPHVVRLPLEDGARARKRRACECFASQMSPPADGAAPIVGIAVQELLTAGDEWFVLPALGAPPFP